MGLAGPHRRRNPENVFSLSIVLLRRRSHEAASDVPWTRTKRIWARLGGSSCRAERLSNSSGSIGGVMYTASAQATCLRLLISVLHSSGRCQPSERLFLLHRQSCQSHSWRLQRSCRLPFSHFLKRLSLHRSLSEKRKLFFRDTMMSAAHHIPLRGGPHRASCSTECATF